MNPPSPVMPMVSMQLKAPDPAPTTLNVGDPAPAFSFMGNDGGWHRIDELVSTGPMLLMFGATENDLRGVNGLAEAFHELGVTPVAVMHLPTRGTRAMTRRLQLENGSRLLSDPMCAIAGLYNSIDPGNGSPAKSYFVVDQRRRIRAMRYGPLPAPEILIASSARALGLPLPESVLSGFEP